MERIRRPVVAGSFYPGSARELKSFLASVFCPVPEKVKAVAVVSPHAGYVYSGRTAAEVFSKVVVPETVVVAGPNHRGWGEPYAVSPHDGWQTPLGVIPVDREFAALLCEKSRFLKPDAFAFAAEHSIEVQLPFIQHANPSASVVAICLQGTPRDPAFEEIGAAIAAVIREKGADALVVASSDMTHYEPRRSAERKDRAALDAICGLDSRLLVERVEEMDISMCGFAPVLVAIAAAKALGAKAGETVMYATSGDVTGDDEVVGYAGVLIR